MSLRVHHPKQSKKKLLKKQIEKDSISLVYNPDSADREIEAFMQHLHQKAAFNGNVLIAKKKVKLSIRDLLAGRTT